MSFEQDKLSFTHDKLYMQRCLELASLAEGRTAPNPLVGALVLNENGEIVGEGYHQRAGGAHAEVIALDHAGSAAFGGTLYLNLEPCTHWGKTPPCLERVIKSQVKRVVIGMIDPNPLIAGKGIAGLKQNGIQVTLGVLEDKCRWLNRGFVKKMTKNLPWLCLKLATTLDGKIADYTGNSRWISGSLAQLYVHSLRNTIDCVMVGSLTALQDDPQLNVRDIVDAHNPVRAVVDSHLTLLPAASLCQPNTGGQTIIFCLPETLATCQKKFPDNVKLVPIEQDTITRNHINLSIALSWLAENGNLTVLCEGGGRLATCLLALELVDEIHWIVSPQILGDAEAVPAVTTISKTLLQDAKQLKQVSYQQLDNDILIKGVLV